MVMECIVVSPLRVLNARRGRGTLPPQHKSNYGGKCVIVHSLDDMADREIAKMSSSNRKQPQQENKDPYGSRQRNFEDLIKVLPDPAREEDGLLADDGA